MANKEDGNVGNGKVFGEALKQIATSTLASSRAAIEAAKATKPSRHTRFVYSPSKGRASS